MTDFLIKSTIPLLVLLTVYHLVLEKEKMHQFNRVYLLFSVVFSLAIPFITIEIIQEIAMPNVQNSTIQINHGSFVLVEETNYLPIILWSIYGLITLLFSIRFIRNILKIISKINANKRIDYKNAKLVLLKEKMLPHTFLNFIFINEIDYNNQKIENELLSHEFTHVTQKHTFDILFIEILKTFFWFNPIFIFYKKAIQLNHEFLADEKVVTSYDNVPFYQSLLLLKANENQPFYLASNLNYLITKKRLLMMTKTTSKTQALLKKAMLIPIVATLLFLLCTKVVAQETNVKKETTSKKSENLFKTYYDKTTFKIKDEKGKIASEKNYNELTPIEKKAIPSILSKQKKLPTNEELMATLSKGAPEVVEIDVFSPENQKVKKAEGETYTINELTENPDFPEGMEKFYKFVGENFNIPLEAVKNKVKGKVYLTFIVEMDGTLSNIKIIRDLGYGIGDEAARVLGISPKWIPGKVNGEAVRTMYSLPITVQSKP
jgi:beta-lactamase regulating signal transducer with metallopeptidase domain